jgi:glycosyltransferase involved in cell wall biosynthesis
MAKEILLTIAIPTYNRAAHLDEQLKRLGTQIKDSVEVLVSDNASDDNTGEIVNRYKCVLPNLVYCRNAVNLGFDRNIIRLYCEAKGEYIWFLSDDDAILPGALLEVLSLITVYTPTVAVLGMGRGPDELSRWKGGTACVSVFESLSSVPDYSLLTNAIFLSDLLVKKDAGVGEVELLSFAGSNFVQLSLSFILLSRRFKFCLAQELAVVNREPGYVTKTEIASLWFCGPARAMNLPDYGYDLEKVKRCVGKIRPFIRLLLCAKLGMYSINPVLTAETSLQMRGLLGTKILFFVTFFLALYRIAPAWPFKALFVVYCVTRYGAKDGMSMFRSKTTQAFSTKASGF